MHSSSLAVNKRSHNSSSLSYSDCPQFRQNLRYYSIEDFIMNLDRAIVLLIASANAVAGFAPPTPGSFTVARQYSSAISSSVLFSEVEDATEVEEEPKADQFETSIYVGNISFDLTDGEISDAFAAYGEVVKVSMPTDRNTGKSRGFAFVKMANAEATAAAIGALNESELGGRTIYVSESLPKDQVADNKKKFNQRNKKEEGAKIYVGNLDFGTTSETLKETFAEYGEVKDCFIPSDYDGNPRGFAFIQMEEESALKAIEELNGIELDGRTIVVNKSLPKGQKAKRRDIKLYVGNLSWGTEEASLRELFEEYGKVVDCYIPTDRETGQHRGFAFVTMDPDDAMRAADETDGYELDGRILRVNEAQPKGFSRSYDDSEGYDGGDVYDEPSDESWGSDSY
mmetsp:Transcript_29345/g.55681  ORF Transcript_29345/g.55681 Transcript_29345/m.55681 type:complete len:398 (-) Transcript_29345:1844-3037(-)